MLDFFINEFLVSLWDWIYEKLVKKSVIRMLVAVGVVAVIIAFLFFEI